jgi:hypothetical protein
VSIKSGQHQVEVCATSCGNSATDGHKTVSRVGTRAERNLAVHGGRDLLTVHLGFSRRATLRLRAPSWGRGACYGWPATFTGTALGVAEPSPSWPPAFCPQQ